MSGKKKSDVWVDQEAMRKHFGQRKPFLPFSKIGQRKDTSKDEEESGFHEGKWEMPEPA